MEKQFEDWGMTAAEREIGMLILKGLSHKEVAGLRGTSEATVRQQAQSIYQKANLPGKTAFSAYFLEDLLMPEAAVVDSTMSCHGPDSRYLRVYPASVRWRYSARQRPVIGSLEGCSKTIDRAERRLRRATGGRAHRLALTVFRSSNVEKMISLIAKIVSVGPPH
jgi:DNA-binding CsgD family transcriptional regulator